MVPEGGREHWASRLGFILAAAGSAIGLGNIWRFPYMTGENGGAAFVVVYLGCVIFIGLPLLITELALGRASGKDAVGAFRTTKPGTPFVITGFLCLLCCFLVLTYYSDIAGWTIGYAVACFSRIHPEFQQFASNPMYVIPYFALFLLITIVIVEQGIHEGIEKWSKVLMPLLFLLILVIIIRSVTLPGAEAGIEYYLKPDFTKISGKVALMALGQAFFSLSVGWGLMITYGSYMEKGQNIASAAVWVAGMDTLVALMGGMMVFPAVFAFGMRADTGTSLTFVTLPVVFEKMPLGWLFGGMFFLLLTIAALTSTISMLEVPVSYLVDEHRIRRRVAAWSVGIAAFLLGIPSAASTGASEFCTKIQLFGKQGVINILDYTVGNLLIIIISLLTSIYVGWIWGADKAIAEIKEGCSYFDKPLVGNISLATLWKLSIKYVCPMIILFVLADALGLFGS